MAFEPYLSERMLNCYKSPPCPTNAFDPNCTVSEDIQLTRDRWNILRSDPCQRSSLVPQADVCNILKQSHRIFTDTFDHNDRCGPICKVKRQSICPPPQYDKGETSYNKDFQYPKSHHIIDDCCTTPCPCEYGFPELPTNIYYCAAASETCPPLDDCTTYKHFYVPHSLEPRPPKKALPWDPCECPMEVCSITRTDYTRKEPIPTGPSPTEIIKHGVWSTEQFCKEFSDETTTGSEFKGKCAERRMPYLPDGDIAICKCCPMREDTTTRVDFRPKIPYDPCYPDWICNDEWRKPDTNMERCTTYGHFYKPYAIPAPLQTLKVGSPGAIPFCTTNKLCYSGHDPTPNQTTPLVMYDNDPWPVVKRTPFRYSDNLQVDPCAGFCDETIYKSDYYAKTTCGRMRSVRPISGHVSCLVRLNDDTTMKTSYPAYNACQYKYAFGNAGNPNGIDWGPFVCPPEKDKCLPRFIAPYGNPLKPLLNRFRCPCGPFDNRSSYNKDFIFRSRDMVVKEEESICRQVNVAKGDSLYRSDFVSPGGKKAATMEPSSLKGYRCMNPCTIRDTNTLYRLDYYDFWKNFKRDQLELYRGHSTNPNKKVKKCVKEEDVDTEVILVPMYLKKNSKPC